MKLADAVFQLFLLNSCLDRGHPLLHFLIIIRTERFNDLMACSSGQVKMFHLAPFTSFIYPFWNITVLYYSKLEFIYDCAFWLAFVSSIDYRSSNCWILIDYSHWDLHSCCGYPFNLCYMYGRFKFCTAAWWRILECLTEWLGITKVVSLLITIYICIWIAMRRDISYLFN